MTEWTKVKLDIDLGKGCAAHVDQGRVEVARDVVRAARQGVT
jgi:hypothetical protein